MVNRYSDLVTELSRSVGSESHQDDYLWLCEPETSSG